MNLDERKDGVYPITDTKEKNVRKRTDRRILKTRAALQSSLIKVVLEKGFAETTVQNVIDRAGVSRSTFYEHYASKEALLTASVQNLRAALLHHWLSTPQAAKGELGFVPLFIDHVCSNRPLWVALNVGESGTIVNREFREMLAEMTRRDLGVRTKSKHEAYVSVVVGGLMGLVEAWMEGRVDGSPQEVSTRFQRLLAPSVVGLPSHLDRSEFF